MFHAAVSSQSDLALMLLIFLFNHASLSLSSPFIDIVAIFDIRASVCNLFEAVLMLSGTLFVLVL